MSTKEVETLEDKQAFLIQEIVNKNRSKEQFQEFLKQQKPGAENDLSIVSMTELNQIVQKFVLYQEQQEKNKEEPIVTFPSVGPQQSRQSVFQPPQKQLQSSDYINQKKNHRQSFALNKNLEKSLKEQGNAPVTTNNPSYASSSSNNLNQSSFPVYRSSTFTSNQNQSVLKSEYGRSVLKTNAEGEQTVRLEAVIAPETSVGRETYYRKNLEGEECSKVIACKKLDPLSSKIGLWLAQGGTLEAIKVEIKGYQILTDGLLGSDYAVYNIDTPCLEWSVQRRFTEFEWLKKSLEQSFKGIVVPPIPEKTAMKYMSQHHLFGRMKGFELFIEHCLLCEILRLSPQLSDFLSITDSKLFASKRAMYDKGKVNFSIPYAQITELAGSDLVNQSALLNESELPTSQRFTSTINEEEAYQSQQKRQSISFDTPQIQQDSNSNSQQPTNKIPEQPKQIPVSTQKEIKKPVKKTTRLVDDVVTPSGEATCEITPPLKEFFSQFEQLADKQSSQYEVIYEGIEKIQQNILQAGQEAENVASYFYKIEKAQQQFNIISPLSKLPLIEQMNCQLSNFFTGISEAFGKMSVSISEDFLQYIKFQKSFFECQVQTISMRKTMEEEYLAMLKELNEKKVKLFKESNTSKWEIEKSCPVPVSQLSKSLSEASKYMLPTKTREIEEKGEYFGFINKSLFSYLSFYLALSKEVTLGKASSLASHFSVHLNELILHCADSHMQFVQTIATNHDTLTIPKSLLQEPQNQEIPTEKDEKSEQSEQSETEPQFLLLKSEKQEPPQKVLSQQQTTDNERLKEIVEQFE